MKTRQLPGFLILLSFALILSCTPMSRPVTQIDSTVQQRVETTETTEQVNDEVFAVVSVVNGKFAVAPDPIYVQSPRQKVTWITEDPKVAVQIVFKHPSANPDPKLTPPGNPCSAPGRRCSSRIVGGGGPPGRTFRYLVRGIRDGKPLPDLDPDLIILY